MENKLTRKDEDIIRNRFERDVQSAPRQASFSHWESIYDHDNRLSEEKKNSCSFRPSSIYDLILKRDITSIILHIIVQKGHSIQEYMGIIHLKNSFYMINQKFIVLITKLDLVQLNLLLYLFQDMEDMFLLIGLNIIWII